MSDACFCNTGDIHLKFNLLTVTICNSLFDNMKLSCDVYFIELSNTKWIAYRVTRIVNK